MGVIVHGNKNFGYAPINVSEQGVYSFGTPVMLQGMVSSSMEVEQEDTNIYADDKTYCVIKGAKVRSIDIALRYIPSSYATFSSSFFPISAIGGYFSNPTLSSSLWTLPPSWSTDIIGLISPTILISDKSFFVCS